MCKVCILYTFLMEAFIVINYIRSKKRIETLIYFVYYYILSITNFMNQNKFTDDLGVEYDNYKDYVNSPNLDPDLIYNYLARGNRTPQNTEEKEWQIEGKKLIKQGGYDISFN